MRIVAEILRGVLTTVYESTGFSILLAALFMFFVMYAKKTGLRQSFKNWWVEFKTSANFRWIFVFAFYTAMVLFRTLLGRDLWLNPLRDVLGGWWIYNAKGVLTSGPIENVVLLMPFAFLLLAAFGDRLQKKPAFSGALGAAVKYSFLLSLAIELMQMFLRLGTVQLSDLVYNTLGGAIGGIAFGVFRAICRPKKK